MRKPLLFANWKLNGDRAALSSWLSYMQPHLSATDKTDVVLLPSYVLLSSVGQWADSLEGAQLNFSWGGQNVSDQNTGAYSGEVSATQLRDVGCTYTLVGHSERRHVYGEDNRAVSLRLKCALEGGLIPVLCVGETQQQRESGMTEEVLKEQLSTAIESTSKLSGTDLVLAYEPVWAIGSGVAATAEQAQNAHSYLRNIWAASNAGDADALRIVYGGSVNAANAGEFVACADVDGLLVGSASLDASEFASIYACFN